MDLHWNVVAEHVPFALDFDELWSRRERSQDWRRLGRGTLRGVASAAHGALHRQGLSPPEACLPRRCGRSPPSPRGARFDIPSRTRRADRDAAHRDAGSAARKRTPAESTCRLTARELFPPTGGRKAGAGPAALETEAARRGGVPHLVTLRKVLGQARLRERPRRPARNLSRPRGPRRAAEQARPALGGRAVGGGASPMRLLRLPSTFLLLVMRRLFRVSASRRVELARRALRERAGCGTACAPAGARA